MRRCSARHPSSLSDFPHECAKVAFGAWQTPGKPTFTKEKSCVLAACRAFNVRCAVGLKRMAARRGAQAMALPLPSVAAQQTPSRRATRRAGRPFGLAQTRRLSGSLQITSENESKTAAKRTSGALARKARQAARVSPSRAGAVAGGHGAKSDTDRSLPEPATAVVAPVMWGSQATRRTGALRLDY